MIAFRIIFFVSGILLTILAGAMIIPALLDIIFHDSDWVYFALSSGITLFFGVIMVLAFKPSGPIEPGIRETFLITVISWIALCAFGSLPFMFSYAAPSLTDALFESTSALTTTGASALTNLDFAPKGILLWRALLQWLGGVGIVLMALVILPNLRIGGMQLFRSEFSDRSEKMLPRVSQIASAIFGIYGMITLACTACYWFAGMRSFEALCNAMTTVSTAGLSTSDSSFQVFDSPSIEMIACVFMLIGASPLVIFARVFHGDFKAFFKDAQIRAFLGFTAACTLILGFWLWNSNTYEFGDALRFSAFSVISMITTTGFASADWGNWGTFPVLFLFFLMFIGGCTGSTAGGIKIFRYQVLLMAARLQMRHLRHPHRVNVPHYNRQPLNDEVFSSVLGFFALYLICYALLALGLSFSGLDILTSLSGSALTLGNVGVGIGPAIDPSGSFSNLPDLAKWLMMIGMIVGRLELLTVLILLTPNFWKS